MPKNPFQTCFVLHGGKTSEDSDTNRNYFSQFSQLPNKKKLKIVLCYWAKPKSQWEQLSKADAHKITSQSSSTIQFSLTKDPTHLFQLLSSHDVLYVPGGEAELIEPYLLKLGRLKSALTGKYYFGVSMGAFIVSSHYVLSFEHQDSTKVHQGLGIIPIMCLCHWNLETNRVQKIKLLKEADNSLPIHALNEQQFATIYT